MSTTVETLPVNFRKQDHSPAAITAAVEYAISVADGYLWQWTTFGPGRKADAARPLAGLRILEIGPGATLGVPVALACAGATVAVADRFPASWDREFHAPFFEAMLPRIEQRGWDGTPIRRLLAAGAFVNVVAAYALAAEDVGRIGQTFDLVLSNAVLEHVQDLQVTTASLARITAKGGYGMHQVDLRDHRDFDRPLEFLTVSDDEFAAIRRESFCECGGSWRASDVAAAFTDLGFSVYTHPNLSADPAYVAEVRSRLRPEFATRPDADLLTISALFVVSFPTGA